MHLVVGLGNPGSRYRHTRHNVGFWVAEELARRWAIGLVSTPAGRLGRGAINGAPAALLLPGTYMNLSGDAVAWAMARLGVAPADLIVVHDDLDLEVGRIRVRARGSGGGHLGMRSVLDAAGTPEVARVRVGVGRPPPAVDAREHVLARAVAAEQGSLHEAAARAADAVEMIIGAGLGRAMNLFNRPPAAPESPQPG